VSRTQKASTYWGPAMSDTQYAVFHFDVKTKLARAGGPLIFDSLHAAEQYCEGKIAAEPLLGCRILDHTGAVVRTFANDQVYQRHHGRPAAKRTLLIGLACLAIGAGGVSLDAWFHWHLVFGVVLGLRFLWTGTMKTAEGISGLMADRGARRRG